ncbi:DNA polymerase III subunit gamma/tau [Fusobacterium perfoetens]|uniref:DNA polymerase III subunit gamma/tau n=1 Tax=Fusobacterium perfoetens TaxID=852 RepID=UPI001F2338BC|nr:DNA polymerase III subunit gamma/tau [Fusobacterium perfoetens]MCF2625187.1 DNA polymerase III subunit gamma/tau [Fusobacterium perfoetens]
MHITLYRKYRPKDFSEIAGEGDIVRTLKNSLDNDRISHAYLFSGPRGVGKTTSARLIAKGVNCLKNGISSTPCNECENCREIDNGNFIDLIEIDAASNRGIDEIRELKDKINYQPSKGRKKIYIIDEVHMLTKEAFNALLKTLEEPPEHVIFILATTEPDKILPTIISRCQRYDFQPLTYGEVKEKLSEICRGENVEIDEGSLGLIYESSGGSMRDAISILERVIITYLGEKIDEDKCSKVIGVTSKSLLKEFLDIIKGGRVSEGAVFLDKLWLESLDIEKFFKDFGKYVKNLVLEGKLEAEEGLGIIGNIFDSLNKFKSEEDKRLLGYVVLNSLIKKTKQEVKEVVVEKQVVYKEAPKKIETSETVSREVLEEVPTVNISLEDIKNRWTEIVRAAKNEKMTFSAFLMDALPYKVEENILYIRFNSNLFAKEQMETEYYNTIFQDVVERITGVKLRIKYIFKENKNEKGKNESDFTSQLMTYFSEEN